MVLKLAIICHDPTTLFPPLPLLCLWYLDSTTTSHVMPNKGIITSKTPYLGSNKVHVRDGRSLYIQSIRSLYIQTYSQSLSFKHILYVPKLKLTCCLWVTCVRIIIVMCSLIILLFLKSAKPQMRSFYRALVIVIFMLLVSKLVE